LEEGIVGDENARRSSGVFGTSGYTLKSLNLSWTGRERECEGGKEGINIENTMGGLITKGKDANK
jgi:hypothetical protein